LNAPALLEEVGEIDRKTYLGSSDSAAIMGVGATYRGQQQTPLTVFLKKTGQLPDELAANDRLFLDRRKRFEHPIIEMLREEFDGEIVSVNKRYRDPEHSFLASEIDFEWRDDDGSIQNGEIKTVSSFAFGEKHGWGEPGSSDLPVHYAAQVMDGLMVTGRRKAIVAALVGLDDMKFYVINRDDEVIDTMRAEMVRFWHEHILPLVPPPPQTAQDLSRMFLKYKGHPVQLSKGMLKKLAERAAIMKKINELDKEREAIEFDCAAFIAKAWGVGEPENTRDDAALLCKGIPVGNWSLAKVNRLDQALLRSERPEIIKQYTRPKFHRKFDINPTLLNLYNRSE
jgi:predicted phage-related endonuclease